MRAPHRLSLAAPLALLALTGGAGCAPEPAQDAGPGWRLAAPMLEPRSWHGLVVLRDGRVLAVGGIPGWAADGSAEPLASAELYDPVTGTWRATAPMASPRSGVTPVLLKDGRVLVAGGIPWYGRMVVYGITLISGVVTDTAEVFDPATETWSATGSLAHPRGCSAVPLADGRVLCAGGWWDDAVSAHGPAAEAWDPVTGAWSLAGDVPGSALGLAAPVAGGRVLVVGTASPTLWADTGVVEFDAATGAWRSLAPLPHGVAWGTLTPLPDGRALLVGGCRFYFFPCDVDADTHEARLFDPATGAFEPLPPTLSGRFYAAAAVLPSGRVLVMGGNTQVGEAGFLAEAGAAEVFDPALRTWSRTPVMPHFLNVAGAAVVLGSGEVLHAGGMLQLGLYAGNADLASISSVQIFRE